MSLEPATIFLLGAGPVATSLAKSLRLAGQEVLGLWARRAEAVAAASKAAQVPGYSGSDLPKAVMAPAEIIIVAVRDAAIAEVATKLAAEDCLATAPVVLHCSGAIAAETALAGALGAGGLGLLHPLRAFPANTLVESFEGTTFGVQGDAAGHKAATQLCLALKGSLVTLQADQLAGYHAAAALASNYVVTLLHAAEALAARTGLDPVLLRKGLLDLSEGAISKVRKAGPLGALTGPIRRGDRATIETHLQALASELPEASSMYREIGCWTVSMARQFGDTDPAELDEIYKILSGDG